MITTRRKFYRKAEASPLGGAFTVLLDGRAPRTPAGRPLAVPDLALAGILAAEWNAQDKEIRPSTMPVTQLVNTAIDRIPEEREQILAEMIRYGASDLLCYRAEHPLELVERQERLWAPLLDWAAETLGGARLEVATGILPVAQPDEALEAIGRAAAELDDLRLAGLAHATAALGSVVLGLALAHGRLDAEEAFALSLLDETFQAERWGEDHEAAARRARLGTEIAAAAVLLAATPPSA